MDTDPGAETGTRAAWRRRLSGGMEGSTLSSRWEQLPSQSTGHGRREGRRERRKVRRKKREKEEEKEEEKEGRRERRKARRKARRRRPWGRPAAAAGETPHGLSMFEQLAVPGAWGLSCPYSGWFHGALAACHHLSDPAGGAQVGSGFRRELVLGCSSSGEAFLWGPPAMLGSPHPHRWVPGDQDTVPGGARGPGCSPHVSPLPPTPVNLCLAAAAHQCGSGQSGRPAWQRARARSLTVTPARSPRSPLLPEADTQVNTANDISARGAGAGTQVASPDSPLGLCAAPSTEGAGSHTVGMGSTVYVSRPQAPVVASGGRLHVHTTAPRP